MKKVKTLFISDVHLGTKKCQADKLLEVFRTVEFENLIIVGDFIDLTSIKRKFYWKEEHSTVIQKILRMSRKGVKIKYIGTRHGEKLYESLMGSEEGHRAIEKDQYFRIPLDTRSLDYQIYFDKGQSKVANDASYSSQNTEQLSIEKVADLVSKLPEFLQYKKAFLQ